MARHRLVGLREVVDQAWAQVENVYQRRLDLIPNFVRTVEGQANFEKGTRDRGRPRGGQADRTGNEPPNEVLREPTGGGARDSGE